MTHMTNPVYAVLELLPEPAFLLKDGRILWCNSAARRLPLEVGKEVPALLPDVSLPENDAVLHWEADYRAALWEVTVQKSEDAHLFLLRPSPDREDSALLLSAARGIQPSLDEIVAAGGVLFPLLEEFESEEFQNSTAAISRSAFRLLRIVGDMNTYARLQHEEVPLAKEKCDLTVFCRELTQRAADVLLDAGIRLDYAGPDRAVFGSIDRTEVRRAVLHLISNAAKYGGAVTMKAAADSRFLRITVVSDSSIEEHVLATAFSRFRQPADLDSGRGVGLGLPIVQALARRHGGSVLLSSRDARTEVTLCLNVSAPADGLSTPRADFTGGYDPYLVGLSGVLPASSYDSRCVDL